MEEMQNKNLTYCGPVGANNIHFAQVIGCVPVYASLGVSLSTRWGKQLSHPLILYNPSDPAEYPIPFLPQKWMV